MYQAITIVDFWQQIYKTGEPLDCWFVNLYTSFSNQQAFEFYSLMIGCYFDYGINYTFSYLVYGLSFFALFYIHFLAFSDIYIWRLILLPNASEYQKWQLFPNRLYLRFEWVATSGAYPMTARSKAWVCGLSLPEIAGSNPAGAYISVSCYYFVLSGRGLCDELITRPEESYRVWWVFVCDLETSRKKKPRPALGRSITKNYLFLYKHQFI